MHELGGTSGRKWWDWGNRISASNGKRTEVKRFKVRGKLEKGLCEESLSRNAALHSESIITKF